MCQILRLNRDSGPFLVVEVSFEKNTCDTLVTGSEIEKGPHDALVVKQDSIHKVRPNLSPPNQFDSHQPSHLAFHNTVAC